MVISSAQRFEEQIHMPGMPMPRMIRSVKKSTKITQGQMVQYLGHVNGGPKFGVEGIVLQTLKMKAIVDLGLLGRWHIPYFFLSISGNA